MDHNEITLRVIGILTESQNMYATMGDDAEADYEVSGAVTELFNELLPAVAVPSDATVREAGEAVAQGAAEAMTRIAATFTSVFSELARLHDGGRTDITTEDFLRDLALRNSSPETGS